MSGVRDFVVRLALVVSCLVPVYFIVAALGTKFGWFDWRIGFGLMTFQLGAPVLLGATFLALIAIILAVLLPPRSGWKSALVALIIPLVGLSFAVSARSQAQSVPPIHDISTDLEDRPQFSQALLDERARVPDGNPVVDDGRIPDNPAFGPLAGERVAAAQRGAYRDISPLTVNAAPDAAFDQAIAAARSLGWEVHTEDRAGGQFEASVQSFWYGFVDDIVVRVRAGGSGSIVDVRSVSRVGVSDLGANAARIRAFRDALTGGTAES